MLGEKLAELVSFIGEDKAEALPVHSAIESDFTVFYLNRKCLGFMCAICGSPLFCSFQCSPASAGQLTPAPSFFSTPYRRHYTVQGELSLDFPCLFVANAYNITSPTLSNTPPIISVSQCTPESSRPTTMHVVHCCSLTFGLNTNGACCRPRFFTVTA